MQFFFAKVLAILTGIIMLGSFFPGHESTTTPFYPTIGTLPFSVPNCVQPPSNVNLSKLSNQQLAIYGLPPKPRDATLISTWRFNLLHAKHRSCSGYRPLHPKINIHPFTSQWSTTNYAGNLANSDGYNSAWSYWNVPCVNTPNNAFSSAWVGIGGYPTGNADRLIQAGTDSDMTGGTPYYTLWVENLPDYPATSNFHPTCGDRIWAVVYNDYLGKQWAYEEVEDVTRNVYWTGSQEGSSYIDKSSISAEWIVEGDYQDPDYIPLTKFGSVHFNYALADRNGVSYNAGSLPHDYAVMCTNSFWGVCGWGSTQLAHPGPISSDGNNFTVYWDNSQ